MRKGPIPAKTNPWGGIVEKTPAIWVSWIIGPARHAGVAPESLAIRFHGTPLHLVKSKLTFGQRYYFSCPICNRRCEAVYRSQSGRVGCRLCCRLGYASQIAWASDLGQIDRLFTRQFSRGRRPDRGQNQDAMAGVVQEIRRGLQRRIAKMIEAVQINGPSPEK